MTSQHPPGDEDSQQAPLPPIRLYDNTMNRPSTIHHEPQHPQLYQGSQPYRPYHPYETQHVSYNNGNGEEGRKENNRGTKRKASQFDVGQLQGVWPPKPEHLPDILSPVFHYFMGHIDIEEISGSYKDKHRNKTVSFTASMSRSGINVKLKTIGVSQNGPAVADAGDTVGRAAATVTDPDATESEAGSSGEGPDGNPPEPASAEAS
ncbi:hypothetical protein H9Q69_001328 [Fusarium xylarioides]|uniref:Uncharacterized protein n=1 Tax=Fusarium xylarioides TaxID=221167 RepID=A0A9P7HT59_9HYPO|nr:hypothetical protein H9Q70_012373 [Fusarium xylarioides]KAG5761464.1 hypothetical protein H9Q72_010435 [Fusarium xylarioides]KAG5773025.1 hypothetical protein H9Q73_012310 [Fusarium xylarioides]KAG5799698.1 hypothetical protein H9Q69_001328 [Fusarium xylarioides]